MLQVESDIAGHGWRPNSARSRRREPCGPGAQASDKPDAEARVLILLDELQELSEKTARAAVEALPDLDRRGGLSHILLWLDLGVALAESSGASALKYFKNSPLVLGLIEQADARTEILTIGLEIAEQDRQRGARIHSTCPADCCLLFLLRQLRPWLDIGIELTQINVVVGLEFIRQISKLVPVLPLESVRSWAAVGMKLIVPNSLGKPDYMATIEFLRTSPAILGQIEHSSVREKVVSLCLLLAEHSPESSITWLAESPDLLDRCRQWMADRLLQYGALLAEKLPEVTLQYLRRASELVNSSEKDPDALTQFEKWFRAGMEVAAYSPDGARAYFSVESRKALASVEEALSGVPFRQVARRVKLFVQGLCGSRCDRDGAS